MDWKSKFFWNNIEPNFDCQIKKDKIIIRIELSCKIRFQSKDESY